MKWFLLPSYDRLNVGGFIAFIEQKNLLPEHACKRIQYRVSLPLFPEPSHEDHSFHFRGRACRDRHTESQKKRLDSGGGLSGGGGN
jgi:hypothetical protein